MDNKLNEIFGMLTLNQNAIPKCLLHKWADYEPIAFIDALDCRILLPFELCIKWEVSKLLPSKH